MTEVIRPGADARVKGMLGLEELREEIERGTIDTILTCFTDMQGRLMGKRVDGEYFLEDVASHGVEGCNYLLALDMEMDPVPGYAMANWETGYGDFHLGARVLPPEGLLRRGAREALPRDHAHDPLHPRLPHPRDHLRRERGRRPPPRDARRRH